MAVRIFRRTHLKELFFGLRCFHGTLKVDKNIQFCLSDIGEGIREVTIKSWHVKVDDKVSQFDNICDVESDKATVTITSRYDGIVKKLYYNVDDIAFVGKPLADIDVEDESGILEESISVEADGDKNNVSVRSSEQTVLSDKVISDIQSDKVTTKLDIIGQDKPVEWNKSLATPAVRRIAMQYNIKLSDVKATGKNNRVLKEDILAHIDNKDQEKSKKVLDTDVSSKCEVKPVTRVMKTMIRTMTQSNSIPTFGYADEIDFTKLVEIRSKITKLNDNLKITYLPFVLKALSKSLHKYPILNASIDEKFENIIYKNNHNIGIAVDSPQGLLVPNVKNIESKSILEISNEIQRLQKSAFDGTLTPNDLTGGTFSVSNIGAIGGIQGLPLILPPEVAIVAVGRIQKVPRFNADNQVTAAHLVNFTFSADHRIIDGATVSRFSSLTKKYLENPELLLIEL